MNLIVRGSIAAAAGFAMLLTTAGASAAAGRPREITPVNEPGPPMVHGADGTERTIMCAPDQFAMGGGFLVSAGAGQQLATTPADVITSRPTEDSTGWIVAVKKNEVPTGGGTATPADLTVYVVCAQGEMTTGA
ncbi:hypothetical protein ABT095_25585 [Kitasatospora sp. NPDC002227]|uniref:hypothetical protein n=1 Tax=Kitasatospora sp. NPDC002227 TaxID=3154773 RepID=UPI0033333BEC